LALANDFLFKEIASMKEGPSPRPHAR
jgi:hypothetical protein